MPSRLTLILLTALFLGCSNNNSNAPVWLNQPEVQTASGPVMAMTDARDTWTWKGIPFAAPPVEDLRFRPPQDPEPWEEPLTHADFTPECIQFDQAGSGLVGQEDCLTLNIWRPKTVESGLPVYVWIHGGGNTSGSAAEPAMHGANLAARSNVVYVSLQYRLGPFGWFYDPALHDGDSDNDSGNFGTLDLIKGLEWIRQNIGQFGGDPDRVLISGESAGGINVISLLLSPRATGLFSHALSQSGLISNITTEAGATFSDTLKPKIMVAEGLATDEADARDQLDGMHPDDLREILTGADPASIMNSVPVIGVGLLSMPFTFPDGAVIVSNGTDAFAQGNYPNKVPLMIGTNSGDTRLFQFFLNAADPADPEFYNLAADIGGQLWKLGGADSIAAAMSEHADQPPVYTYSFEWGHYDPGGNGVTPILWNYLIGAAHALDISFFLDTLESGFALNELTFTEENQAGREALSETMTAYVSAFLRTGDPNSDELPDWNAWSNADGAGKYIILDADLSDPQIGMSSEAVTEESIQAQIDAISDPVLKSRIEDFIYDFIITCAIVSDNPTEECD